MIGNELETLLRRVTREELAKLIGVEPGDIDTTEDDEIRTLVQERAAKTRSAKGGAR